MLGEGRKFNGVDTLNTDGELKTEIEAQKRVAIKIPGRNVSNENFMTMIKRVGLAGEFGWKC